MSAAERPAYVPPLDRARNAARQALADAETVDIRDHLAVVEHFTAVQIALRNVLRELDEADRE